MIKNLIETSAKSLVDYPEEVEVKEVKGDHTIVFELSVAKEDLGKVIGKQGKTALAIRWLVSATATKQKLRAHLEIIE